jgi:hypothetical protein
MAIGQASSPNGDDMHELAEPLAWSLSSSQSLAAPGAQIYLSGRETANL